MMEGIAKKAGVLQVQMLMLTAAVMMTMTVVVVAVAVAVAVAVVMEMRPAKRFERCLDVRVVFSVRQQPLLIERKGKK